MSEAGEFGPEFTEEELNKLGSVKDQAEKGKIGGPEDKPREDREFTMHPEPPDWEKIDPAWKDLSPELRKEFRKKFGRERTPGEFYRMAASLNDSLRSYREHEEEIEERFERHISGEEPWGPEGFLTNVDRGTSKEEFCRILEKDYPEVGVRVRNDAEDPFTGEPLEGEAGVFVDKEKGGEIRTRVYRILHDNPIMQVLDEEPIYSGDVEVLASHLEEQGVLEDYVYKKVLARLYRNVINNGEDLGFGVSEVGECETKLKKLGVEPLSDEEVRELILKKVVISEFGPTKQKV